MFGNIDKDKLPINKNIANKFYIDKIQDKYISI